MLKLKRGPVHKKDLVLIHGAWSTNATFNYLVSKLEKHPNIGEVHFVSHDIQKYSIRKIIQTGKGVLDVNVQNKAVIVGHSLGGVIAMGLHDSENCDSIITAASPLDGMHINKFLQGLIMWRSPFLTDAFSHSDLIREIQAQNFHKHIDVIVTTYGYNPALFETNDGVVTVRSQQNWIPPSATMHYLPFNHHEVLQTEYFCEFVKKRLETP